MKSIIIVAFILLGCVAFNEALQCYSHDACTANCPQLKDTIKTCGGDDNKCYKGTLLGGVTRGCAKERCTVQVDGNAVASSICCEKDLCNSAITSKLTFSTFFIIIAAFVLARM
ncbi:unnamed protein product [Adineta steineri]|uniref:Uncharacterized protein n=1 Tax=Adineta steineri TaxID=433720 RepID=A0A815AY80_9BILA|nr:unnamed protein product [Adineta steineri]CAF4136562.1 unnamed protein product [Adineta steineri]